MCAVSTANAKVQARPCVSGILTATLRSQRPSLLTSHAEWEAVVATGRLHFNEDRQDTASLLISHTRGLRREKVPTASLTSSYIPPVLWLPSTGKAPAVIVSFSHSPFSSTARTQAPLASSSSTTAFRPLRAATCRGLRKNTNHQAGYAFVWDVPFGQPALVRGSKWVRIRK